MKLKPKLAFAYQKDKRHFMKKINDNYKNIQKKSTRIKVNISHET